MERRGAFRCRIYRGRAPMMTSPAALRSASAPPAGAERSVRAATDCHFSSLRKTGPELLSTKDFLLCNLEQSSIDFNCQKKVFFTDAVETFADVAVYPLRLCCRLAKSRYIDGLIRLILRSVCNPFAVNTRWVQTPCFCQRPKNL